MHVENITSNAMSLDRNGQSMLIQVYEKEIDRLNNLITELEKWLEERTYGMNEIHTYKIGALEDEVILNKLKELKEDKC